MARTRLAPRQSPPIVMYHGDDMATLSDLKRKADAAANGSRTDDGADERAAYEAFLDEAAERAVEVVIQAIGPKRWQDLVLAHPPRMEESEPDEQGRTRQQVCDADLVDEFNTETLPRALLMYVDPDRPSIQTIIKPEFDDEADRAEFVDFEIAGDFERLWRVALAYNTTGSRNPKDPRSDQRSDESTT